MTQRRLLVVTTVHHPDDARIRSKLIPTLGAEWEVSYACRTPGPSDNEGLSWIPLRGGRLRRALSAGFLLLAGRWDLVAIHDPELLAFAFVRSLFRRPTLFDLHENLPAQIRHKEWLPRLLRAPLALMSRWMLGFAERLMTVTVAEEGYLSLLRRPAVVIPNHLLPDLPAPSPSDGALAYLGDITVQRGALLAIEAAAGAGCPLVMVGRVSPPELVTELFGRAADLGVELDLAGPLPHRIALELIAPAAAGLSPLLDVPNYRHSLPTKVLEYLGMGLPVAVADLPGTMEVLAGLDGVVAVVPGEPAAWKEAGAAVADPALRDRAQVQMNEVRARFSWDRQLVLEAYRVASRK